MTSVGSGQQRTISHILLASTLVALRTQQKVHDRIWSNCFLGGIGYTFILIRPTVEAQLTAPADARAPPSYSKPLKTHTKIGRNSSERTLRNTEHSPRIFLRRLPSPPAPEIGPRWPATAPSASRASGGNATRSPPPASVSRSYMYTSASEPGGEPKVGAGENGLIRTCYY